MLAQRLLPQHYKQVTAHCLADGQAATRRCGKVELTMTTFSTMILSAAVGLPFRQMSLNVAAAAWCCFALSALTSCAKQGPTDW